MAARILVIRGGAIGDFVVTLPAIKLLREAFPEAHLEILGYRHIVALGEGRFYADASRSIEYGAMAGFFVPRSELAPDLVEYFASFQQIVSYLFDPEHHFENSLRRTGAKHILQAFVKIDDSAHAAQQLARPLERLALYLESPAATLHPKADDRDFATRFLAECDERPLIALHPGSGSGLKNWPIEKWAEFGKALMARDPRPQLLLVGGEADYERLDALVKGWSDAAVLVARDLPLPELAALLERATRFVGHDSGISHIAAAVGAPCTLLFGPTDPTVWAPANAGVTVIAAPGGDLSALSVDAVLAGV